MLEVGAVARDGVATGTVGGNRTRVADNFFVTRSRLATRVLVWSALRRTARLTSTSAASYRQRAQSGFGGLLSPLSQRTWLHRRGKAVHVPRRLNESVPVSRLGWRTESGIVVAVLVLTIGPASAVSVQGSSRLPLKVPLSLGGTSAGNSVLHASDGQGVASRTRSDAPWRLGRLPANHGTIRQVYAPLGGSARRAYAAASVGLLETTDSGRSWTSIGASPGRVGRVTSDPRRPRRLFVAVDGLGRGLEGGIATSPDGGRSWSALNAVSADPVLVPNALVVHPRRSQELLLGAGSDAPGGTGPDSEARGIYRSTDGGRTWRQAPTATRQVLSVVYAGRQAQFVYAATDDGVLVSQDRGVTWRKLSRGLRPSFAPRTPITVRALAVSPSSATVFAGIGSGVFRMKAGGTRWTGPLPAYPEDVLSLTNWRSAIAAGAFSGLVVARPVPRGDRRKA